MSEGKVYKYSLLTTAERVWTEMRVKTVKKTTVIRNCYASPGQDQKAEQEAFMHEKKRLVKKPRH